MKKDQENKIWRYFLKAYFLKVSKFKGSKESTCPLVHATLNVQRKEHVKTVLDFSVNLRPTLKLSSKLLY